MARLLLALLALHAAACTGAGATTGSVSCGAPVRAVNCGGHSLVEPPPKVASAAGCCAVCANTPSCAVWNWNTANKLCYPKLNCSNPTASSGQLSGGAIPSAPPGPAPGPLPGQSPLGILNATAFGVDNSGATDTTARLQAAISAAYEAQLALFLPPGRYLVSATLWANQSNYGSSLPVNLRPARWRTNVLLGSTVQRPVIVLAPHSPGFADRSAPRNVLKLHNTGRENDHMNQIVRSIDFEVGEGNPGAVALYAHGAQGTTVQDVTVRMIDGLAGFGGGGGAGASHLNIAAYGGQFGVRFDASEPGPVVAGGLFVNQSVTGVAFLNVGIQGPLIVAGVRVVQAAGASGAAIAGAAYIVDSVVDCDPAADGVATASASYLRGVFTKGCALTAGAKRGTAQGYMEAVEVAVGSVTADGHAVPAGVSNISSTVVAQAPDVIAMHISDLWSAAAGFERAGAVDAVADCHATGDGVTDDTEALQACLDSHDEVFLPKGLYRISKTLVMKAGGSLVGLSPTHSVIAPTTGGFAASGSHPHPLLRTAAGSPVSIAFVGLVSWWHIAGTFTLEWNSKGGLWRSNYETRVCECMWLSDYGSPNAAHGKMGTWPPTNCTAGVELSVPKTQIHGTGSFYNYVSDEDVLFTDHVGYRDMLVSNNSESSTDRLRFYAINLEHSMAEANGEFRHASHVDVFGLKKEGSTTILWIRDCVDINVIGTAGGYSALLDASAYPEDFAPYRPAIYRVERTSPLKLAMTPYPHKHSAEESPDDVSVKSVKCSYPLDTRQLQQGHFPKVDWPALIASLWAPWCGYWATGSLVLLEADGPTKTLAAIVEPPPTLYTRGYPLVQKMNRSATPLVALKSD